MTKIVRNNSVQAVSNALKILEILSNTPKYGVSELARILGCQKGSVFRLLSTLKNEGYITQDEENEKYSLTLKLFKIGSNTVNNLDLNTVAFPIITRLSKLTSETIHRCIIENNQLIYLQKIESTHALKVTMMSRVGQSTPLYCTGVGKVLLAYQNIDTIQKYIQSTQFEKFTEHTVVDPQELTIELEKVRSYGIAYDNEEHELGVRCVAAPIFDQEGTILAALSISGPTVRMIDEKLKLMRELVKNATFEISTKLGYSG
jgi:DNA-binding IclR family transcriptional regulator